MKHKQLGTEIARKSAVIYLVCVALLSAALALAACSPQLASSVAPTATSAAAPRVAKDAASITAEIQPAITPTTTPFSTEANGSLVSPAPSHDNKADSPVARSYHAVLMLERAADLQLAVIEKIQAGQISPSEGSAIARYTNAFPLAVEDLNQANPPAEMEDIWNQVFMAAQQYNQAYSLLNWRQPISPQNLDLLKETRRLLTIDQEMVERYLAQSGLGPDFFSAQQQAVDQHLQQRYGNQSVPSLVP